VVWFIPYVFSSFRKGFNSFSSPLLLIFFFFLLSTSIFFLPSLTAPVGLLHSSSFHDFIHLYFFLTLLSSPMFKRGTCTWVCGVSLWEKGRGSAAACWLVFGKRKGHLLFSPAFIVNTQQKKFNPKTTPLLMPISELAATHYLATDF